MVAAIFPIFVAALAIAAFLNGFWMVSISLSWMQIPHSNMIYTVRWRILHQSCESTAILVLLGSLHRLPGKLWHGFLRCLETNRTGNYRHTHSTSSYEMTSQGSRSHAPLRPTAAASATTPVLSSQLVNVHWLATMSSRLLVSTASTSTSMPSSFS